MDVNTVVKDIAAQFSLSESQLIQRGIKAFLQDQLHMLDAELRVIFARHQVKSLEELYRLMADHPEIESDLLPEFQRAEYLTTRIEEVADWINRINARG